jgi:hypothetical protein
MAPEWGETQAGRGGAASEAPPPAQATRGQPRPHRNRHRNGDLHRHGVSLTRALVSALLSAAVLLSQPTLGIATTVTEVETSAELQAAILAIPEGPAAAETPRVAGGIWDIDNTHSTESEHDLASGCIRNLPTSN